MKNRSIALNFHGLGCPDRTVDEGEHPYWVGREIFDQIVTEIASQNYDKKIFLTFDDGNKSDIKIAAPILKKRGIHAQFFVLTGRLNDPGYLSANDIMELRDMGFGIGSHGVNHKDWKRHSRETVDQELKESRHALEGILDNPVTEVAIPFGSYGRHVLQAVRSAGYVAAWTSDGGMMDPSSFLRPRLSIRNDMDLSRVANLVERHETSFRRMRRKLAVFRKKII